VTVSEDDLIFLPLGGAGEIGMNLNLYGYRGRWMMVDLGITFADESQPGIDIITPDPTFIAERRDDLDGLVLTHAHEDHLGAVALLWPWLECPIWATPFTATLLRGKLSERGLLDEVTIHEVPLDGTCDVGPFHVRFVSLTHSIPEPNALVIETGAGRIFHTGDWKIDPDPLVGDPVNEAKLRDIGDAGVLAMICDSTNALSEGRSGSEAEVRDSLLEICRGRTGRIAITSFASNVARIDTVGRVARACGRHLVVVGRSLWRAIAAARANGYLDDLGEVLEADEGAYLPPDKVLYLCTGCQGEARGAMARIAGGQHPDVVLERGDTVIFSSKVIPGNERTIGVVQNQLAWHGVEVIGERDAMVHVSGHPCREELSDMYRWIRPRVAIPVHGEYRHMMAHAELARALQVPHGAVVENGQMLRIDERGAEVIDEVQSGRWLLDGDVLIPAGGAAMRMRRKMMFNGSVAATMVTDRLGNLVAAPSVIIQGVPWTEEDGDLTGMVAEAIENAVADLPKSARRDDGRLSEAASTAIRRALRGAVGKRPLVESRIVRI
jgi:ribonuclease J